MQYHVYFEYGENQHFDGILSFSGNDVERLRRFHAATIRLKRCRLLSENLILQVPTQDMFTLKLVYPPALPEADLVHFVTYLRPFMYKMDLPHFYTVLSLIFSQLPETEFFVQLASKLRRSFEKEMVNEHVALARQHINNQKDFLNGKTTTLGFGDGWWYAMQFGYVEDADWNFVEKWLYGEIFHQRLKHVGDWDRILQANDIERVHMALRAHLLYIYNSVAELNNFIVKLLCFIDRDSSNSN